MLGVRVMHLSKKRLKELVLCIHPARAARKVETTWAFPAAAAPLLRLVLGPVPVDEIAWILFRRTWVEPRT